VLFSDEPTAGLDPIMSSVVDVLTQKVTSGVGITAIVVTHDMTSAFRIGTRMLMLGTGPNQGKVLRPARPKRFAHWRIPRFSSSLTANPMARCR
jgi:phospholipid/cholesterol/gamma-HCH transport system ATP-binding protein